ncbi:hypothetical protein MACK_002867 [Theileria orientalis]|uniref:Repressor of RNA polymerase III transcription n=1 Tax=Theileria orientalis TaxID=68886 RepID=A0A976QU07_THEOR|nr:hypothetical protein MACK_002867 [Theileria orientalis]
MIFLEHTGLSKIASILHSLGGPDRYFDAKLELASYSKSDSIFNDDNNEDSTYHHDHNVTSYFKTILNKCFQDYDFSTVNDSYFKEVKNLDNVVSNIYYNVSIIVGRIFPDFVDQFWFTIKQVVHIRDVDIYTFDSGGEDDPFNAETCINSFNYFLVDKKQQHILFVSCITRTRADTQDKSDYTPSFQMSMYVDSTNNKLDGDCLSETEVPEIL